MLSCMETQLGLMVIGPQGQALRLQRSSPAFQAGRELLKSALPAEQAWAKLQELLADPRKAVMSWFERFGLTLRDEGDFLRINDKALRQDVWMPLINRTMAAGGSPAHLLEFARQLDSWAPGAQVGQTALHVPEPGQFRSPGVLRQVNLPAGARRGDIVTAASRGKTPYLVSYHDYKANDEGELLMREGVVLCQVTDALEAEDILTQPQVLGFNRTYRCEEGSSEGWLEDLSFDSLMVARTNAKEIQASGSEARIVNRITGDVVSLL